MLCLALITDKRRISTFHLIYLFKVFDFRFVNGKPYDEATFNAEIGRAHV